MATRLLRVRLAKLTHSRERYRRAFLEQLEDRSCPSATVFLSPGSLSITEGGMQMVMVQATGSFSGNIVVSYQTNPGTAASGTHATWRRFND